MGVLGHSEDIQAPFIDVLQVLLESRQDDCKCFSESHNFHVVSFFLLAYILSITYLRQQFLLVRLNPETIAGTSRDAGRVADLPHPTDLSHHPTLLLLLLLLALPPLPIPRLRNWTRKLQLILLIWIKMEIEDTKRIRKK